MADITDLGVAAMQSMNNYYMASNTARENYEFSTALANQQNMWNYHMWQEQNAYNSPKAQMQRYVDAGLSPNLMYSQGNSGNSGSIPHMVSGEYHKETPQMTVGSLSSTVATWLGLAREMEALKTQKLENADLAGEVDAKRVIGMNKLFGENADVSVAARKGLKHKIRSYFDPFYAPDAKISAFYRDPLSYDVTYKNERGREKTLKNTYEQKMLDFFNADKVFHYITPLLRLLMK